MTVERSCPVAFNRELSAPTGFGCASGLEGDSGLGKDGVLGEAGKVSGWFGARDGFGAISPGSDSWFGVGPEGGAADGENVSCTGSAVSAGMVEDAEGFAAGRGME